MTHEFMPDFLMGVEFAKPTQRPENKGRSVPVIRHPKPEVQKKHIKQTGKK